MRIRVSWTWPISLLHLLLPLVPLGVWLGVIIQGKLEDKVFYQISYWSLLAIGMKLLYDGAIGLLG